MKTFLLGLIFFLFSTSIFAITRTVVTAKKDMVVTEDRLATNVGVDILKAGGNAIDAAVAVGYALAVVYPCCGNIGGGGFMVLHLANGKNTFLNFREKAPFAAKSKMYLDAQGQVIPNKSLSGYLSVAVPGTVLGLDTALKKYGTMNRQQVMAPAIKLAKQGFILTPSGAALLREASDDIRKNREAAAIFLKNNQPYQPYDRIIQKNLGHTLTLIAQKGPVVFYRGEIANTIVKANRSHGGILQMKDFAAYNIEESTPLFCIYYGYTIITSPPPGSGTTLCEMLNILEYYPLTKWGHGTAKSIHYITEAMRFSFADRNFKLGDPHFVHNPTEQLISKKYAAKIRSKIQNNRITPSAKIFVNQVEECEKTTTHYSIVDRWGNSVSLTYTLNSNFGAGIIAGNTGFFLNNEMDDFTSKSCTPNKFGLIMGRDNRIQGGKRPLSSMTPTIIMKDGKIFMILGSPGGPRIITSVLLTILNVLNDGMNIKDAINEPRFHHQGLPDILYIEPFALSPQNKRKLSKMGYHFSQQKPWGKVEAILIDPKTQIKYGANDKRAQSGKAMGNS